MSELTDCTNSLSAKDILRGAARTGPPFYINALGLGDGYCTSYQTVYDYLTTKPSDAIATTQNTMYCGMVDAGIAAKMDAFWMYAQTTNGASEALPNWINPGTYDCTLTAIPPAFVALEGFTGLALNSRYIITNWNPNLHGSQYTVNSASFGVYVRTDQDVNQCAIGIDDGSNDMWIYPRNSNQVTTRINDAGTDFNANLDARGFYIANRTAANARAIFKNGASVGSDAQAATALPNRILSVLGRQAAAIGGIYTGQVSIAFVGAGLTNPDITTLTNLVEAYMDSNGKGVIP